MTEPGFTPAKAINRGDINGAKQRAPHYGLHILKYLDDSYFSDTSEFAEVIRLSLQTPPSRLSSTTLC